MTPSRPQLLPSDFVPREGVRRQLLAGQHLMLESRLNSLQAQYEAGERPDSEVVLAYGAFNGYRPDLTGPLERWVAARPDSYAARTALGMHLFAHSRMLRTFRLVREVPPERWAQIQGLHAAAKQHFEAALLLTAQPFLPYTELIGMGMVFGEDTWDRYMQGVERCPGSVHLRSAQLSRLRIEWGGSLVEMQSFLLRPENKTLSPLEHSRLEAQILYQEGHHFEHFQQDRDRAKLKYRQALETHPYRRPLLALTEFAETLEEVEVLSSQVRALDPDDDDIHMYLGLAYLHHGFRARQALKNFDLARAWGHPGVVDMWTDIPWGLKLLLRLRALLP